MSELEKYEKFALDVRSVVMTMKANGGQSMESILMAITAIIKAYDDLVESLEEE